MIPNAVESSGPKHRSVLQRWLPWFLLLVVIAIISAGVYRKAYTAKVPPVFDAFEYYVKAFAVWNEVEAGHPERVFSLPPHARPPGSAVINMPFGFADARHDFRKFFFYNIMMPVWMWGAAAALLLIPLVRGLSGRWLAAATLGSLMSMPMFYQMEYKEGIARSYAWGFQDCVVAALAALALALLLASVRQHRLLMSLLGGFLAAWTVFVKPVGLLLMPLIFAHWLVEVVIRHWPLAAAWRESNGRIRRYLGITGITLPLLFLAADMISFRSPYLSKENWNFATKGQQLLLELLSGWGAKVYLSEMQWGMGYLWFTILALGVLWSLVILGRLLFLFRFELRNLRWVAALLALSVGMLWWIVMAGPLARYLYPFQLCFLVIILPPMWEAAQRKLGPVWKGALSAGLFAAPILLAVLLWARQPSERLQHLFRLNLSTGGHEYCIDAAQTLLKHVHPEAEFIPIYKPEMSWIIGAMESWHRAQKLEDATVPDLAAFCPLDWSRGILVRRKDLMKSEFIVFEPLPNPEAILAMKTVPTADLESQLLTAWFGQLTPKEGVQKLQGGELHILQITDRVKLDEAFRRWMATYQFRAEFYAENQNTSTDRLRAAFEKSPLIYAYHIGGQPDIQPMVQAAVEQTDEGLLVEATGTDAQLRLPKVRIPPGTRLACTRTTAFAGQQRSRDFLVIARSRCWISPRQAFARRHGSRLERPFLRTAARRRGV